MGPNSGGGKRNKTDAAKVSSARGRFSNCAFPGNSKAKRGGKGGRGGRGAGNAAASAGRGGGRGGEGSDRGSGAGGRPSDAAVIKKLSERVSSGATSGVKALDGECGGRDPLKGVDVASLDEISIAEADWQNVFRLLKDIGLFENSSGPTDGNDAPATAGAAAGPRRAHHKERATHRDLPLNSPSARTPTEAQMPQAAAKAVERRKTEKSGSSSHDPAAAAALEYLTEVLAFPEADASRALSNTSGADLGEALDYLCLHTDEAALKKYFRRGTGGGGGKGGSGGGVSRDGVRGAGPGGKKSVAAGIEVVRSSTDWKAENRVLTLVKMGFHREEAEAALAGESSGEIMGHDTLSRLLEPFFPSSTPTPTPRLRPSGSDGDGRDRSGECSSGNPSTSMTDSDLASVSAREEEATVLLAIFEDGAFRVFLGDDVGSSSVRWEVDAALEFNGRGISADSTVTILFQEDRRYPHDAPLVLVTNKSLPPGLARRLTEAANAQASRMAGPDPIVYKLVCWLQGASKEFHAAFLREAREREERRAEEKRERAAAAAAASGDRNRVSKGSRGVSKQNQQALRSSGNGKDFDNDEEDKKKWRMACLKGLNSGLNPQEARDAADMAAGRSTASTEPSSSTTPDAQKSTPDDDAAERKLRFSHEGEDGVYSEKDEGVLSEGVGADAVAALVATGDGYRAAPYLQEMMQVLEETSENQPWLEAAEAKDLPLPPLAHAAEKAMQTHKHQTNKGSNGEDYDPEGNNASIEEDHDERLKAQERAMSASLLREFEKKKRTRAYQEMLKKRSKLPAYEMRDYIVSIVRGSQVVVVSGETGCGKTTQVPQLVLDTMIQEGQGASANVIVTQPRRISAVGVAERIAAERAEKVGETAGYQIRLEAKRSRATRLLLCTTGILLRRLQVDPWLASVSHVFVDEVHERDLDTDFLLIILKGLLERRPGLKLVLMSATLNATMFSDFFWGAPVVEIPGRAHPVTPFFLEDVLERTGYVVDPKGDYAVKEAKRGGGGAGGGGGARSGPTKPGDWTCPSCGNNCFASKTACNRCGARKPDGGGGRGRTQMRPGDWDCPSCGNNCFASKSVCNRCNTTKPSGGRDATSTNPKNGPGNVPGGGGRVIVPAATTAVESRERPTIGQIKRRYGGYSDHVHQSLLVADESVINYEAISRLLEYITFNFEEGAILVFLPGLAEITKMLEELAGNPLFNDKGKTRVYPLHGSLSTSDQRAIFEVPPRGVRKIVVATNIAETSITIEDCVFVIDSCRVKENRFDDANMMPMLLECWVSKASAKQRRGRAGRVRPGVCFHMCSSATFENELREFQLPEMLRVSLDDMVLQILLLDKGSPAEFLASAVNPPTDLAVANSIKYLCELQATQLDDDREPVLTALGFHLATLPVEPRVGKMMLYGAIFGCVEPAITIAAAMSCRNPFVAPFDKRDIADESRRSFALALSDHLTLLKAYDGWRLARGCGSRAEREYLRDHFLSRQTLVMVEDMRKQFRGLLRDIGFIEGGGDERRSNANGGNIQLIKAVVCAGLYPNVAVAPPSLCPSSSSSSSNKGLKGGKAPAGRGGTGGGAGNGKTAGEVSFQGRKGSMYLHPMMVTFERKELDSRYGVYHEVVKTSKVYIRDMTTVTPLMLALFGGSLRVHHERQVITVDKWLHFRVPRRAATLIKHLRMRMERLLLRKITHPQEDLSDSGRDVIQSVSMLLRSGAVRSGAPRDYSTEMLAAEINGARQGSSGFEGLGNHQGDTPEARAQQEEQQKKQLRVMQRRERDDAVRRNAQPAGGRGYGYHNQNGNGNSIGNVGGGGEGVSEEELFAPLRAARLSSTSAPVKIPSAAGAGANSRPNSGRTGAARDDGGGGGGAGNDGRGGEAKGIKGEKGASGTNDGGFVRGGGHGGRRGGGGGEARGRGRGRVRGRGQSRR